MKCIADGCLSQQVDRCHIKTKGSGGSMESENIVMMCRVHHTTQHKIGWVKFARSYPSVMRELDSKGWEIQNVFGIERLVRK